MGVITCTVPMNPSSNVTYTHKKFKRATSEASDNVSDQHQHSEGGRKGGSDPTSTCARPTTGTPVGTGSSTSLSSAKPVFSTLADIRSSMTVPHTTLPKGVILTSTAYAEGIRTFTNVLSNVRSPAMPPATVRNVIPTTGIRASAAPPGSGRSYAPPPANVRTSATPPGGARASATPPGGARTSGTPPIGVRTTATPPTSARPMAATPQGPAALVNGHVSAQVNFGVTGGFSGPLSFDSDDIKRKTNNTSGGKYKCEYCGMGCAKPSVLDKHKRTHTNERPYSCEQCSLAFKTKSNYMKHTRSRTHARKREGAAHDNSDGTIDSGDNVNGEGDDAQKLSIGETRDQPVQQILHLPTDLSKSSNWDHPQNQPAAVSTHQEEVGSVDRIKSLYKPKFHITSQYAHTEDIVSKCQTSPPVRQRSTPPRDSPQPDPSTINPATYQLHAASRHSPPIHTIHSNLNPHSPGPAAQSKHFDVWTASKKDDIAGPRNSVATPPSLWKGIKSPSPELVGQHITKLIVENQAIVETHNPLWSRRYRRQPSLGSSSSESDGSGTSKGRRSSLADVSIKSTKVASAGPTPGLSSLHQQYTRERSQSLTAEAMMVETCSSYTPSLPPNSHLPLAQPPVTHVSASKPSISSQGHTTSYSQSAPAFTTSTMGMMDYSLVEGSRKRSASEGPTMVRDILKSRVINLDDPALLRQHPQNPEGSVIKNLLLTARANVAGLFDQNLERLEAERANPPVEVGHYVCTRCGVLCRTLESLEIHHRHYCGPRPGGSGSERGTPDSVKSGDGGRWPGEQDVALDLQKKPERIDPYDRERSSSRGSSVGEASQRRGSEEENRYRLELSPRVFRSESVPDTASPPTKKRKISEPDVPIQDRAKFLSPMFSPRGHAANKNESGIKSLEDMSKQKTNNHQLFGGEVQICDGAERKTMRIDTGKPPSPTLDICIPPQQLGGNMSKPEVSLPTSVVMTIAKSGLNSGGTMVQVESKMSTSSTKTVSTIVSSSLSHEQVSAPTRTSPSTVHSTSHNSSESSQHPFSPFYPYAPRLLLPNLAIPGIPTPDLASLSFPKYPAHQSSQTFLSGKNAVSHGGLGNRYKASPIHSSIAPPSKMLQGILPPRAVPSPAVAGMRGSLPSNLVNAHGPNASREREKDHLKIGNKSTYPALIPIGDEKVPYVPGIPGPYSQASIVHSTTHKLHNTTVGFIPPGSTASPRPMSPAPAASAGQPLTLLSPSREKSIMPPRSREMSKEPLCSPIREANSPLSITKVPTKISSHFVSKELQRPKATASGTIKPNDRVAVPDRVHQSEVEASEKKGEEKSTLPDTLRTDSSTDDENSEDFLPPRKRPNSLALKPQPYVPKSSLALIGTTLVSPDTPRPKKNCVQMFLNGSAYTYLGHKVSTKSYFCCISRQQPMYVPQSTDPKLSMYSNWQIKPAEDNPLNLKPYQHMSLYTSRKVDQAYTIAKPKELNLIQTHSSYWTFKEKKENGDKNKESEDQKQSEKDTKTLKSEEQQSKAEDNDESQTPIKPEPDDENTEPSSKSSDDAESSDSNMAKRIKIFEGGFKSTEDYTYVRGRGRGRYVCEACGIRCKKPSMLKKHIRTHTDLRPYACSHCSFSFKTKGNLTKHLRSKAHYKRCVEMGVVPVPIVVDESHVNTEALAMQGKIEQEQGRMEAGDDDEDEDDEDEDDEDDEEDEDDDEDQIEDEQFQDADDKIYPLEMNKETNENPKENKDNPKVSVGPTSRVGVLVMAPSTSRASVSPTFSHSSKESKVPKTSESVLVHDSPIDLSVKKPSVINMSTQDKTSPVKNSLVPRRPSFLPLREKGDLRCSVNSLVSPGTPTTPIREHPSEILSPVTDSSSLLNFIYNTTSRASHASKREKLDIVLDPSKENGTSNTMFQAYIKERAVLDTTIKRQQYKGSSSDTSPDSPHNNVVPSNSASNTIVTGIPKEADKIRRSENSQDNRATTMEDIKRENRVDSESPGATREQNSMSEPSPSTSTASTLSSSVPVTNRMPTPPANLTVMNNGGIDTKTAFLVPSGVVPSSLNRPGNDDGKCRCSICHKEFNRPSQLSLHMNIHYMERPYRCDSCAVSFRTNGHLQKHKRSFSHFNKVNMNMTFGTPSTDNPRPFKCHDCKIAFRIHGHLAKHLRSKMHIMKLECLGKLPFGTYAEIERSGANLNEIDTTDCDNSLESLQVMASKLYEKDPSKLTAWHNQEHHRVRTISNSSTNSDDYPLQDDQEDALTPCANDDDTEGDEDDEPTVSQDTPRLSASAASVGPVPPDMHSPHPHGLPPIEIGSGATAGILACYLCHEKFLDLENLSGHLYNVHKVSVTYRNS